jgi:hypothetical protein
VTVSWAGMRLKNIIVAVTAAITLAAAAGSFAAEGSTGGFGRYDCTQWLANPAIGAPPKQWLLGWLSGLNYGLAGDDPDKDPLAPVNSASQIVAWMDNYCHAHPKDLVMDGGAALYTELQRRISAPPPH